jgi:hypothetical protein
MSRLNQVETNEDSGFVQAISPDMARRQLKLSAALVGALAVATALIATLGQFQPRYGEPAVVKLTVQAPGSLQTQQANTKISVQPGG